MKLKQRSVFFSIAIALSFLFFSSTRVAAVQVPVAASVNDKYSGLVQVLSCPQDAATYGQFRDYGYWGGGAWCGQSGQAGFWVWVAPNWYVWSYQVPPSASANGKYSRLIQIMTCPNDQAKYGQFTDYGYWGGGAWCGQVGKAGFWVWNAPNWYVWQNR